MINSFHIIYNSEKYLLTCNYSQRDINYGFINGIYKDQLNIINRLHKSIK